MEISRENSCMIKTDDGLICIDPTLPVFSILGKKYTILILSLLGNDNTRNNFNDIANSIPGASRRIISMRLHDLENEKIIEKTKRNITEYRFTEKGYGMRRAIINLLEAILNSN